MKKTLLALVLVSSVAFAAKEEKGASPAAVGGRIVDSFLAEKPTGKKLTPADVLLWVNALDFAERHTVASADKLAALYKASVDDALDDIVPAPKGFDGAFFAALPFTLSLRKPDAGLVALGLQHVAALPDIGKQPRAENASRHALVLMRAFAATKERKYGDRAQKDIVALAQKLQRKDGLFASVPGKNEARARGNGSMALAILSVQPAVSGKDPNGPLLRKMLADFALTVEPLQRPNGLWGQVVDDPKSPDDPAGSVLIATALAVGAESRDLAWGYLGLAQKTLTAVANQPKPTRAMDAAVLGLAKAIADENTPFTAAGTRKKPRKPGQYQLTPAQRADAGEVAAPGQFRLESTYACISVAWGAPCEFKDGVGMSFRKTGETTWRKALEPEFYSPWKNYRGSIVNLDEDTEYEVRLEAEGETQVTGKVRTWASKVPVAKTVEIDPATAVFPIVIKDEAPANGWIRYVPKGGAPLVNGTKEKTFVIAGAKHVILDGFTIVGGHGFCSILVDKGAEGVRILNCEISGFGPDACGAPNGAICLGGRPHEVTIERCFVHSPRGRAQSWRYEHPYGPQAVRLQQPYSLVIRWCDFVGCESHRFDDVIKCDGNAGYHSGLNRNADVCGNFLFGANDDCIELDGGQQNVRFFGNRCEEALMGVSIQCNMTSPSYVFDNVFTGLGTEFGHRVSAIKTASVDTYHYGAVSYLFHNTFCGPGSRHNGALDVGSNWETARLRTYNNLFVGRTQFLKNADHVRNGRLGGNVVTEDEAALASVANACVAPVKPSSVEPIANFSRVGSDGKAVAGAPCGAKAVTLPERPVPWELDTGRLVTTIGKGVASPASSSFRLVCGGKDYKRRFAVRTPAYDNGWYDVSPKEGTIESGKAIDFTVTFRPEKANRRHRYAAAFVIRTDDGFGRPVSLHATTDYVAPFKVENPSGTVVYGEKTLEDNTWEFDLPKAGTWYLYLRGSHPDAVFCDQPEYLTDITPYLNDVKLSDVDLPVEKWSSWVPLDLSEEGMKGYKLEAGVQKIRLGGFDKKLVIEGLLFATNPMDIEDAKRE